MLMVRVCLVRLILLLSLVYLATTDHHQELDNVANRLLEHHKLHKANKHKLENVGKFKQSSIGDREKKEQKRQPEKSKLTEKELVKEFETFTNEKHDHAKTAANDGGKSEEENELKTLLQTVTEKVVNEGILTSSTGPDNQTVEDTTENNVDAPHVLRLTSDNVQHKRNMVLALPQDDSPFVFVVIGVAFCCIVAILGVGFFLHRPSCSGNSTPWSDCSPTFHKAKLAFSSSPDKKLDHVKKNLNRSFAKYSEPTIKNQVCSKSSEGFKFQESCSENNNYQSSRGHLYQYQGALRQESLIDIDGPEEEDDDTIYECPGLAPHGEMEVTNPFFLQREFSVNQNQHGAKDTEKPLTQLPCPVNASNSIRHNSITIAKE